MHAPARCGTCCRPGVFCSQPAGLLHATPNWNLVNATLQLFGPCTEEALCKRILLFQGLCCVAGLGARWALVGIYK